MRLTITLLSVSLMIALSTTAQSLKKYPISNSGCSAYFFCDPGIFEITKSPDSSEVYTAECKTDEQAYGIICIKLKEKIADLQQSEDVMVQYLDFLKTELKIAKAAGYGKGHRLKNSEATRGIIDYWEDQDKDNWKINAWTNGAYIAVMYVYSKKELVETKANLYFEGLRFPGM
ncbi:MAG: hypothetical protein JSS82_12690 [Bacteroidetes bacterium]|nr:hypothetical protein [Bacteroidota bacterium]